MYLWKRKKEVWLGTLPGDACCYAMNVYFMMVTIITNDNEGASLCPWNHTVRLVIVLSSPGFMFDTHFKVVVFSTEVLWLSTLFKTVTNVTSHVNFHLFSAELWERIPPLKVNVRLLNNGEGFQKSPLQLFGLLISPGCSLILLTLFCSKH